MINLFGWFRKKHDLYDESSDCFVAKQYALKQYEEQFGCIPNHDKILKDQTIIKLQSITDNSNRYTLQYLYKNK